MDENHEKIHNFILPIFHFPKINFICTPPPPHLAAAPGGTMRDMTPDTGLPVRAELLGLFSYSCQLAADQNF